MVIQGIKRSKGATLVQQAELWKNLQAMRIATQEVAEKTRKIVSRTFHAWRELLLEKELKKVHEENRARRQKLARVVGLVSWQQWQAWQEQEEAKAKGKGKGKRVGGLGGRQGTRERSGSDGASRRAVHPVGCMVNS